MSFFFFFMSFAAYLHAMPGTIPVYRDSGDLIAASVSLGIAHPPGYPFYVLLGKLCGGVIPWANMAYRVNLLSALTAAAAVALLYRLLLAFFHANEMPFPKMFASLLSAAFGLSPAAWSLARTSEMYALASAFAVLILACCCLPGKERPRTAVFLLTLGLGVHPTLLFLTPLVAGVVWDRATRDQTLWVQCVLVVFIGMSIFLFLPLRGSTAPELVWGDPLSWRGIWRLVTRADYGGLKLHPVQSEFVWTPQMLLQQLLYFMKRLGNELGWPAMGLLGLGLYSLVSSRQCVRRDPSNKNSSLDGPRITHFRGDGRLTGLLLSFLLAGPVFFVLSNLPLSEETTPAILEPYLLLVNLLGILFIAYGVAWFFHRGSSLWAMTALAVCVGFALPIHAARLQSSRDHFYAYDYGRNLFRTLPMRAVLYDPDDPTAFTLRALQLIEHRREDVVLLNFFRTRWGYERIRKRWPDLLLPGDITNAQDLEQMFWTYSMKRRPFFAELPQKVPATLVTRPEGLVYRIGHPQDSSLPLNASSAHLFSFYAMRGDFKTTDASDFFTRHLLGYYAAAYSNLGLAYANSHQPELARVQYRRALVIDPKLTAAYNNLGILEYQEGRFAEAIHWYNAALRIKPNDPQLLQNRALALAQP